VYVSKTQRSCQCFKTRPGPAGRPGSVAGPGLSKKPSWELARPDPVDPGPGRPGQTRLRPGFFFLYLHDRNDVVLAFYT